MELGPPSPERDDHPYVPWSPIPHIVDVPPARSDLYSENRSDLLPPEIDEGIPIRAEVMPGYDRPTNYGTLLRKLLQPVETHEPLPETHIVPQPRPPLMADDIQVTILADAVHTPQLPRVGVFASVTVEDSFCVVVGDNGRLEFQATREVGQVQFDADIMRRDLGWVARLALDQLVKNPDNLMFSGLFQALVWASTETPASTQVMTSTTARDMQVTTFDCENVIAGPHNDTTVHDDRQQDTAQLSLGRLVPGHPDLVRALAHAIAAPGDPVAATELDHAVLRAAAGMPEETMLAAAVADGGSAAAQVGLTSGTLTAAGATAVAIGRRVEMLHTEQITIDAIAVTGLWPDGHAPAPTSGAARTRWNDLDWYLLDENGRPR